MSETPSPAPPPDIPEWRLKAVEKLNRIIPNAGNCLACGSAGLGKVIAGEHLVTPMITDPAGSVTVGGTTYPQITLICTHCGFTRSFNYLILMHDELAAKNAS